jgi:catechol 2,3-dioxygenase-like lactoylglutathione lyase family enzyme
MIIDHVNIVVRDLDKMLAFYCDVLGLKKTKDATISGDWIEAVVGLTNVNARVIYLGAESGPRVELIKYKTPACLDAPDHGEPHTFGLRHMAFRVEDIDAAAARLREAGVKVFGGVQQVPDSQVTYQGGARKRLIYFHDPEGNLLEFCEYKS